MKTNFPKVEYRDGRLFFGGIPKELPPNKWPDDEHMELIANAIEQLQKEIDGVVQTAVCNLFELGNKVKK